MFAAHGVSSCESFVGLSLCGVDYSADDLLHAVRTQVCTHTAPTLHPFCRTPCEVAISRARRWPQATLPPSPTPLLHAARTQVEHGARSCEVMVHPGEAHQKGTPWDDFSGSAARQHELDVLTSTRLRRRLQRLVRLQPHR